MAGGHKKGAPKTGGRKAGVPNKATAEIKSIAQEHGPAAIAKLVKLMNSAQSEQAQVAAVKELLDRGYGRAPQSVELAGKIDHGWTELLKMIDERSPRLSEC